MADWITSVMSSLGYWGVALLMFLENVFPPLPSEIIMPAAGFSAGRGDLTLWGVIVAGALGSLLGQYPLYYLGHALGEKRVHQFADRYGKWLTVSGKDIEKASAWMRRRGNVTVLICRLIPGIRSLISIPAGITHMRLSIFTFYSTLGITVWGALLAAVGYALGSNYKLVEKYLGPIGTWIWVALGVGLAAWIAWRLRGCFAHRKEPCPYRDRGHAPESPAPG